MPTTRKNDESIPSPRGWKGFDRGKVVISRKCPGKMCWGRNDLKNDYFPRKLDFNDRTLSSLWDKEDSRHFSPKLCAIHVEVRPWRESEVKIACPRSNPASCGLVGPGELGVTFPSQVKSRSTSHLNRHWLYNDRFNPNLQIQNASLRHPFSSHLNTVDDLSRFAHKFDHQVMIVHSPNSVSALSMEDVM
jgi:hypothetical protein